MEKEVCVDSIESCSRMCEEEKGCDRTFFQIETVCVPVTVTPFATPGDATATCCGDPVVKKEDRCQGNKKSCTFTITQRLCIEIPITFGADVDTGDAVVECGEVTKEPCDCDTVTVTVEPIEGENAEDELRGNRRYFNR